MMKKTEFALETFKNLQDLVKFIDQKISATLVISGLILTVYLSLSKNIVFSEFSKINLIGIIVFLSSLLTLISIIVVIYKTIMILKPRLAKNYESNEKSLFYFEHISAMSKEQIINKYNELDENTILKQIIDQQYEVSLILNKKTIELNKSFTYLFVSILSLIIFVISINLI